MIEDIASWTGGGSAVLTLCATAAAFVLFGMALGFGVRVGADGRPSPAALLHSGWGMSTRQILREWEQAPSKVSRSVRLSYWCDIGGSIALAVALLVAAAKVGAEEDLDVLVNIRDAVAWSAVAGGVAAVVVNLSLLRVVRLHRKREDIAWLALSLAMTAVFARIFLTAFAVGYVFVAAGAT